MNDNSETEQEPHLKVPEISISEPKTPIYIPKEWALNYLKEEFQQVQSRRQAGIEKIQGVKKDSFEQAEKYHAILTHYHKARRIHEIAEVAVFRGVAIAVVSFVVIGATSVFNWIWKRRNRSSIRNTWKPNSKEESHGEAGQALEGERAVTSRKLHSRDWQVNN